MMEPKPKHHTPNLRQSFHALGNRLRHAKPEPFPVLESNFPASTSVSRYKALQQQQHHHQQPGLPHPHKHDQQEGTTTLDPPLKSILRKTNSGRLLFKDQVEYYAYSGDEPEDSDRVLENNNGGFGPAAGRDLKQVMAEHAGKVKNILSSDSEDSERETKDRWHGKDPSADFSQTRGFNTSTGGAEEGYDSQSSTEVSFLNTKLPNYARSSTTILNKTNSSSESTSGPEGNINVRSRIQKTSLGNKISNAMMRKLKKHASDPETSLRQSSRSKKLCAEELDQNVKERLGRQFTMDNLKGCVRNSIFLISDQMGNKRSNYEDKAPLPRQLNKPQQQQQQGGSNHGVTGDLKPEIQRMLMEKRIPRKKTYPNVAIAQQLENTLRLKQLDAVSKCGRGANTGRMTGTTSSKLFSEMFPRLSRECLRIGPASSHITRKSSGIDIVPYPELSSDILNKSNVQFNNSNVPESGSNSNGNRRQLNLFTYAAASSQQMNPSRSAVLAVPLILPSAGQIDANINEEQHISPHDAPDSTSQGNNSRSHQEVQVGESNLLGKTFADARTQTDSLAPWDIYPQPNINNRAITDHHQRHLPAPQGHYFNGPGTMLSQKPARRQAPAFLPPPQFSTTARTHPPPAAGFNRKIHARPGDVVRKPKGIKRMVEVIQRVMSGQSVSSHRMGLEYSPVRNGVTYTYQTIDPPRYSAFINSERGNWKKFYSNHVP